MSRRVERTVLVIHRGHRALSTAIDRNQRGLFVQNRNIYCRADAAEVVDHDFGGRLLRINFERHLKVNLASVDEEDGCGYSVASDADATQERREEIVGIVLGIIDGLRRTEIRL